MLQIYVVYENPTDYPKQWVLRRQTVGELGQIIIAPEPTALANSLGEIRERVPKGLHRIPRMPEDDPKIVEVWV